MSKLASLFVVVAGFSCGQTAPAVAPNSVPNKAPASAPASSGSSASVTPASASTLPDSSSTQSPDLTFKPNPQDESAPAPPPVVTPAGGTPAGATPQVNPPAGPDAAESAPKPAADAGSGKTTQLPKLPDMPLYVLGANDVVGVQVYNENSVPGTYAIGPDGRISLPLIHDFTVIGLTIPQLQQLITQKLSAFMIDPVVNVQLLRNNSKKYTIIGGVGKPGPYPLLQETTVLDALANDGGFHEFANQKDIIIRRGTKEFHFNYKDVIKGKNVKQQNITLQDGDIIVVKE